MTATAAVLTAVGGLIGALNQAGLLPGRHSPPKSEGAVEKTSTHDLRDPHDLAMENSLVGTWRITVTLPDKGIWEASTTYSRDGRFVSKGPVQYPASIFFLTIGGTWFVKDSALHYAIDSTNSLQVPINLKNANKIIAVNQNEFAYEDSMFGGRRIAHRGE